MNKFLVTLVTFALSAVVVSNARADVFTTYTYSATQQTGVSSGTILFDETTGQITGGSVIGADAASPTDLFTFAGGGSSATVTYAEFQSSTDTYQIALPGFSLVNYAGGDVCSESSHAGCVAFVVSFYYSGTGSNDVQAGTLTPASVSAVPEPSSLALLATGLASVTGMARRRFRK